MADFGLRAPSLKVIVDSAGWSRDYSNRQFEQDYERVHLMIPQGRLREINRGIWPRITASCAYPRFA